MTRRLFVQSELNIHLYPCLEHEITIRFIFDHDISFFAENMQPQVKNEYNLTGSRPNKKTDCKIIVFIRIFW